MTKEEKTRALQAFAYAIRKAGGQAMLAIALDCSQARVSRIANDESEISAAMAVTIERRYGIPRHDFRPDLYDRPRSKKKPVDYSALIAKHDRASNKAA